MTAIGSTNANSLIQEQVSTMLVQPLEAESVVLSANPQVFNSSEPLRIPTLTKGVDTAWVGENELIPEGSATFGEIELMPEARKSIKTITRVSNELIRMAKLGVSNVLQQRLVSDVTNKLDDALLKGDGTHDSVTGIMNQKGTQKSTFDASNPDTILDAIALAEGKEVHPNRLFLSGADYAALAKVKDKNGAYVLQPSQAIDGQLVRTVFGIPVTVTNKLQKGEGALVDMSQVAVVRDINPTVTVLNERYAEYDQVGIRCVTRYDLGLLHPEGVVILGASDDLGV